VNHFDIVLQPIDLDDLERPDDNFVINVTSKIFVINWFCGVVGYHFCLTHRRS
jgi:hypothetical protein